MRDLVERIVDLTTDQKMSAAARLVDIAKIGRSILAQLDEYPDKQRTAKEKAAKKDGAGDKVQDQNPPTTGTVVL